MPELFGEAYNAAKKFVADSASVQQSVVPLDESVPVKRLAEFAFLPLARQKELARTSIGLSRHRCDVGDLSRALW